MEDKKSQGAAGGVLAAALDAIGLAAGAPGGASAAKKLAPVLAALILLPVLVIAMLPSVLSQEDPETFLGDNGVQQRLSDLEAAVQRAYETGKEAVLDEITLEFEDTGADVLEISNQDAGAEIDININLVVSMYCAGKEGQAGATLSGQDLEAALIAGLPYLWDYTVSEETRELTGLGTPEATPTPTVQETVRTYTLIPANADILADKVFCLTPEQRDTALAYADNLTAILGGATQ